ncbi:MAG: TonB-dependent receptor [Ignavibacteriae bacterium]|nr:TonB-dependent receptor [Ignavibacteriota bacterium]MCB9214990.1 TonB-dependent receptor [Ignavibacteria bacterium]
MENSLQSREFERLLKVLVALLAVTGYALLGRVASAQGVETEGTENKGLVQTIRGTLRDGQTGQPIPGGTVRIVGTKLGAVSLADGAFRVENVPIGRQTVVATSLGFEPFTTVVTLTTARQTILEISMEPAVEETKGVTVTGRTALEALNERTTISATVFNIDDVTRFAGSREDPARMAGNFAGVFNTDDRRNDIIIRGGSPSELLWRLDGIDIPNPNHFAAQGSTGGPVNALNTNLLDNSDFLTGAFPAEYGDKLSGVFDLHSRDGNTEKYELVAQMGFGGFEGMAEGPIPGVDGASFLASYRKSTIEVFDLLGISIGFDGVPRYDDLSAKLHLPIDDKNIVDAVAIIGQSSIEILDSDNDSVFTGDFDIYNRNDLSVAGLSWTNLMSSKMSGKLTLSRVSATYGLDLDSLTTDNANNVQAADRWFERNSTESRLSAQYRLSYAPSRHHWFTVGVEGRLLEYDLSEERFSVRDEFNSNIYNLKEKGDAVQSLNFINWQWRPTPELKFNTGVHAQYLGVDGQTSIEPRFGVSWKVSDRGTLSSGVSLHRQSHPLPIYFAYGNEDLDFTQAIHYILGYTHAPTRDILLKVEGYYKEISDAPVRADELDGFSLLNTGADFGTVVTFPLKNGGEGRTYGAELSLTKHFRNGWYLLATGSLIRQEYQGSDGIWRFGAFDNKFIANVLGGYEWKLSEGFEIDFSGRYSVAGGAPYTPIDLERSALFNTTVLDEANPFSERNPNYSRLDFRVDFRHNFRTWSISSFFSVENLLNQDNVLARFYDARTGEVRVENQIGLFPVGGFRVEF